MPEKVFKQSLNRNDEIQAANFIDNLRSQAGGEYQALDSAEATEFAEKVCSGKISVDIPKNLQIVLDEAGEGAHEVIQAILDSANLYEKDHGKAIPADVVNLMLHNAYAVTGHAASKGAPRAALDSATTQHHDAHSLQAARPIVAILGTATDAIPFANYLPADISSNEARLAIVSSYAGKEYGGYKPNDNMDGDNSGRLYAYTGRYHIASANGGGSFTGRITAIQETPVTCLQTAPSVTLIRGATKVYVDGRPAGFEPSVEGSGTSIIAGEIKIGSTVHKLSGTINPETGEYAISASPDIPANHEVAVEGFVDYERMPELIPDIHIKAEVFKMHARAWRVRTSQTIDSRTQMANELGIDPVAQSLYTMQQQISNEKHYMALRKMKALSANILETYDFDWAGQKAAKDRTSVWRDMGSPLEKVSQQLIAKNLGAGVEYLYVGEEIAAEWRGLAGTDIFVDSGIRHHQGIYRIGTFKGIPAYFVPKTAGIINETPNSAEILCIARHADTARSPIIVGDAVPPTLINLAVTDNLVTGSAFYMRSFMEVNPYGPSQFGSARITITNLR